MLRYGLLQHWIVILTDLNYVAIIRGSSRLALGRAKKNEGTDGVEVDICAGDVIVIPAGVSHRSLNSEDGFRYIGVYPEVSLRREPIP